MLTENVLKKGLLFVLYGICCWGIVHAQDGSTLQNTLGDPLEQYRQRLTQVAASTTLPPLEGAVDPDVYVVGPGDVFGLTIGGVAAIATTVPVSADGHLVLPDVGSIAVGGKTLAETRTEALAAIRQQYQNVQVDLTLAQPRQFYVHVAGAVPAPRRYIALPISRVSSVVEQALIDTTRSPVGNLAFQPSLRDVRVKHTDGTEESADLLRYLTTGDTAYNPYLQDGDVVFIPPYDPNTGSVYISGNLPYPGSYPYRPGDTIADLLTLGSSSDDHAAFETVRLSRVGTDGTTEHRMLNLATSAAEPLQPRDHVYVVPPTELLGEATVEGFVQFPGIYPIEDGKTDLRALLEQAGGVRSDGLGRAAYVLRNPLPTPMPHLDPQRRLTTSPLSDALVQADSAYIMQQMRLAEFGFSSRVYFAQALRQNYRIHLDLDALLQPHSEAFVLRDGDRVVVPRNEGTVLVFGQVNQPGYFPYVPNQAASSYVAKAGGLARTATDTYVVEGGSGQHLPAGTTVKPGDMVFVDRAAAITDDVNLERLRFEEERNRVDRRSRVAQIVLQAASVTLQTVLIIRNLRNSN